jgi:hypothetical protein
MEISSNYTYIAFRCYSVETIYFILHIYCSCRNLTLKWRILSSLVSIIISLYVYHIMELAIKYFSPFSALPVDY